MPSKQKVKGSNFERDIAKHLSKVFGWNFERVPTSGAMTGGINSARLAQMSPSQKLLLEGDLIPPDELPLFKIECKTLKSFNFSSLLKSSAIMDDWIGQARSDDKIWFLIFKINNRGIHVGMDQNLFRMICNSGDQYHKHLQYNGVTIVNMENFFETYKNNLIEVNNQLMRK